MSKPYLPYGKQIQKLINDKGLIVQDVNLAERMLTDIGYFSLIGGYKNLFINPIPEIRKFYRIKAFVILGIIISGIWVNTSYSEHTEIP